MKNVLLLSVCCCLFLSTAQAQSIFLEKGVNGFAYGGGLYGNQDIRGFTLDGGFSFKGVLDIGVSIGNFRYLELQSPTDVLTATFAIPFISYLLLKQNEKMPISLSLNVSYERQMYSSKAFDRNNVEVFGHFFSSGVSIYKNFQVKEGIELLPSFGLRYRRGTIDFKGARVTNEVPQEDILAQVGISLVIEKESLNQLVFTPFIDFGQDLTTYGVNCIYIISKN